MKTSLLDYYQLILDKVSFDRNLLQKEYVKACAALDTTDLSKLHQWMSSRKYDRMIKKSCSPTTSIHQKSISNG